MIIFSKSKSLLLAQIIRIATLALAITFNCVVQAADGAYTDHLNQLLKQGEDRLNQEIDSIVSDSHLDAKAKQDELEKIKQRIATLPIEKTAAATHLNQAIESQQKAVERGYAAKRVALRAIQAKEMAGRGGAAPPVVAGKPAAVVAAPVKQVAAVSAPASTAAAPAASASDMRQEIIRDLNVKLADKSLSQKQRSDAIGAAVFKLNSAGLFDPDTQKYMGGLATVISQDAPAAGGARPVAVTATARRLRAVAPVTEGAQATPAATAASARPVVARKSAVAAGGTKGKAGEQKAKGKKSSKGGGKKVAVASGVTPPAPTPAAPVVAEGGAATPAAAVAQPLPLAPVEQNNYMCTKCSIDGGSSVARGAVGCQFKATPLNAGVDQITPADGVLLRKSNDGRIWDAHELIEYQGGFFKQQSNNFVMAIKKGGAWSEVNLTKQGDGSCTILQKDNVDPFLESAKQSYADANEFLDPSNWSNKTCGESSSLFFNYKTCSGSSDLKVDRIFTDGKDYFVISDSEVRSDKGHEDHRQMHVFKVTKGGMKLEKMEDNADGKFKTKGFFGKFKKARELTPVDIAGLTPDKSWVGETVKRKCSYRSALTDLYEKLPEVENAKYPEGGKGRCQAFDKLLQQQRDHAAAAAIGAP